MKKYVRENMAKEVKADTGLDTERLTAYSRIAERVKGDADKEDLLQSAYLTALEKGLEFNNSNHFENYLKGFINRKQIIITQQREKLISLNTSENWNSNLETKTENSSLVYYPKNYDLYKWIICQADSKGKRIWNVKQLRVLSKTYLSGKSAKEISLEANLEIEQVNYIRKTIDRKLLSLPIRENISEWGYCGSGHTASQVWAVTDIEPPHIVRNKETGKKAVDVKDSVRCYNAHNVRLAMHGPALPTFLNDGSRPYPISHTGRYSLLPFRAQGSASAKP